MSKRSFFHQHLAMTCCLLTLMRPIPTYAQVGYVADIMMSNLCLTQNWDTPTMQSMIAEIPPAARWELFEGLFLSKPGGRCLMDKKAAPVATCNKVIGKFFGRPRSTIGGAPTFVHLTPAEESSVLASLENSGCKLDDEATEKNKWLPPGLKAPRG